MKNNEKKNQSIGLIRIIIVIVLMVCAYITVQAGNSDVDTRYISLFGPRPYVGKSYLLVGLIFIIMGIFWALSPLINKYRKVKEKEIIDNLYCPECLKAYNKASMDIEVCEKCNADLVALKEILTHKRESK